ncbi:MAG: PIN domain-containing protein [Thermodesulfobacteriota bacterium]
MGLGIIKFQNALKKLKKVGLDSSILIYHLEDMEPYANLTENIFAMVAEGSLSAVLSTVSVTELLVQPFTASQQDRIAAFERFLFSLPNTELKSPDYPIAKEAARLRSKYRIRTPDALLIATFMNEKADAFITNDASLRALRAEGVTVLGLADFVR